jgi:hypothetical protein
MDRRTNVHDKERSGWTSVVSDDLVQNADQTICEEQRFIISELPCEFPLFSMRLSLRLGNYKFFARWVPKMIIDVHKTQKIALTLTFSEQYYKDGNEFLSHIIRVTGDETQVSFVYVETKKQSKQWMHTHSPNKQESLNKCLQES